MRRAINLLAILALLPTLALAGSKKDVMEGYGTRGVDATMGANPTGTDGCGLGWQVTQKKTMLGTTVRATTNAVVPPTFGMTSGTMGCDKHDIAKNDMDAAKFAFNNQEPLTIEMAQGQGEYLAGFAKTLGCEDSAQADFAKMTQDQFGQIVQKGQSPLSLLKNVKAQMKSHPVLSESCRA